MTPGAIALRPCSWAVTDSTDAVLGCVAVTAVNRTHDAGWILYWTVAASRGRGVASAGLRELVRWCSGRGS
ncbi:GNAT family N-acetyltransferase [Streptomyces sp. SYSU K217416]